MQKKYSFFEITFWLIFLAMLFLSPVLLSGFDGAFNWEHVFRLWKNSTFVVIVLLINHFILIQKYFPSKNWSKYILFSVLLILVFAAISMFIFNGNEIPSMERNLPVKPTKPLPPFVAVIILSVLGVSLDAGFNLFRNLNLAEQEKTILEKENVENQLHFLRNQISPHFFMNTLNNIHSLVEIDSEKAQNAIVKLSTLMRYLLYEVQNEKVDLQKEIDFIKSYFSLMQLRVWENVEIRVEIPEQIPSVKIPPTLFVSFIENAFKHGISTTKKSFIEFKMNIENQFLTAEIKNSKNEKTSNIDDEYSGIGLKNIQKMLNLLYPKNHQLTIFEDENTYKVNLKIPI